jgi:hypothetical protein
MACLMKELAMIISCEIILEKKLTKIIAKFMQKYNILVCTLYSIKYGTYFTSVLLYNICTRVHTHNMVQQGANVIKLFIVEFYCHSMVTISFFLTKHNFHGNY